MSASLKLLKLQLTSQFNDGYTDSSGKRADFVNVLAFDYGTRRIGVATGNCNIGTAQGIAVVPVRDGKPDIAKLDELVATWEPNCFVIGIPFSGTYGEEMLTSSEPAMRSGLRKFIEILSENYHLPVFDVDERLTSEEASNRINDLDRNLDKGKKADLRNMIAAEIILETFLSVARSSHDHS